MADWVPIVGVCLAALLSVLGALSMVIFNDMRNQLRTNGKHLDSAIGMQWQLLWRVTGMEDFLHKELDYRPVRIIGEAETHPPSF